MLLIIIALVMQQVPFLAYRYTVQIFPGLTIPYFFVLKLTFSETSLVMELTDWTDGFCGCPYSFPVDLSSIF
jgi:hypothetical protein